ncbi:uncharacterized protein [Aegilops tauschii subsp. strangulata]|uniref:KIB1-4 beta-propeller domain-containing protein n=1 Tax=Aegilops tauschii TaxID=37682 RepID=M8CBR8_AEGTA
MEEEPTHKPAAGDDDGSSIKGPTVTAVVERLANTVDRVRLAAVCTSCRVVTSPRRVHPWLILNPWSGDKGKHAYCIEDGTILSRFCFSNEAVWGRIVGSHDGGWAAISETPLAKQRSIIRLRPRVSLFVPLKVIFSEPPTSSGCILAAIIGTSGVAICGLGRPKSAWTPQGFVGTTVLDIAFCNGHLYCLVLETTNIVRFEVGLTKSGVFKGDPQWLDIQDRWLYLQGDGDPDERAVYIIELGGKIMIATRKKRRWDWRSPNNRGHFFVVFELVDVGHGAYILEHVKSLCDQALFLGPTFSKAMYVSTCEHGSPQRNHIYYSHHRCYPQKDCLPDDAKVFLTSMDSDGCHVYYKKDESVDKDEEGITSVGHYVSGGDKYPPMWLFPPDL